MGKKTFREWQYFKLSMYVYFWLFESQLPKRNKLLTYFNIYSTSFDQDVDDAHALDQMTWRQWLNNALKRSYGIFGEGVEYSFLHVDDKLAYIRVNHADKDTFSSSISTYISTDELVGSPLPLSILQESYSLWLLEVTDDDRLWLKKVMEEEEQDCKCI